MRFFPGQRIGQSGNELVLSVFFSFFLHAALIVLALIFYTAMAPKVYLPPFYEVKLVGQPAESAPAPAPASAPPLAKPEPAPPQPKVKIAAPKPASKPLNKSAMPELAAQKTKPSQKASGQGGKDGTGQAGSGRTGQARAEGIGIRS